MPAGLPQLRIPFDVTSSLLGLFGVVGLLLLLLGVVGLLFLLLGVVGLLGSLGVAGLVGVVVLVVAFAGVQRLQLKEGLLRRLRRGFLGVRCLGCSPTRRTGSRRKVA